ncbi:hypothetical protein RFI_29436, partial [Reticulomyxa filosa]
FVKTKRTNILFLKHFNSNNENKLMQSKLDEVKDNCLSGRNDTKNNIDIEDIKFTYKKRGFRSIKRKNFYKKRKQLKKKVEQFHQIDSTMIKATKLQPLADEQKIIVHKALKKAKKDERALIVDGEYGKLIVSDILLLTPRKWLNDEIINYYAAMLVKRSNSGECKSSVVLLNSFFYSKLAGNGYNYSAVSRWTMTDQLHRRYLYKNVKTIFDLEKVIFPININDHWICGCINIKKNRMFHAIQSYIIKAKVKSKKQKVQIANAIPFQYNIGYLVTVEQVVAMTSNLPTSM